MKAAIKRGQSDACIGYAEREQARCETSRMKNVVTIIKRSVVTDKAVWIYRGKSERGAVQAYWLTCKREMTLQRKWPKLMQQRAANIRCLLEECMKAIPDVRSMTDAQRKAARTLKAMAGKLPEFCGDFYNHIRAERRRRDKKSRRWHPKGRRNE